MGRIYFRTFYTELVEHYLRMVIRYTTVSKGSSQHWFDFAKKWFNDLPDKDREFLEFIFSKDFYNTTEGLYCYKRGWSMETKRAHLAELERNFALKSEIISDYTTSESELWN